MSGFTIIFILLLCTYSCDDESLSTGGEFFETERFQTQRKGDHVSSVYICAHLANKGNYADDYLLLIDAFLKISTITSSESEALKRDAARWWDLRPKETDYTYFWKEMCEEPTENLRKYMKGEFEIPNHQRFHDSPNGSPLP